MNNQGDWRRNDFNPPPGGAGHLINRYLNLTDNNVYLDNSDLTIKVIAHKDLEYQYYNTFVVRYQHIPPLGTKILGLKIGCTFLLSSTR